MLKLVTDKLILATALFTFFSGANAFAATNNTAATNEKYNIMKRDQNESSDVFAIPFDDSEIEDEGEINRDEKKDVFPLNHSK